MIEFASRIIKSGVFIFDICDFIYGIGDNFQFSIFNQCINVQFSI